MSLTKNKLRKLHRKRNDPSPNGKFASFFKFKVRKADRSKACYTRNDFPNFFNWPFSVQEI